MWGDTEKQSRRVVEVLQIFTNERYGDVTVLGPGVLRGSESRPGDWDETAGGHHPTPRKGPLLAGRSTA